MNKKILLCVEGKKTEEKILNHLFKIYGLDEDFAIVSYKTNIYQLYKQIFERDDGDPEDLDFIQVLKERETNPEKRELLNERYTDIFLVFDFDPQDHNYDVAHLAEMLEYFCESTDHGKLYLNYPMAESFYHMPTIPDTEYLDKTVPMSILKGHGYKTLVNQETVKHSYAQFAVNKNECNIVIKSNRDKAWKIIGRSCTDGYFPEQKDILNVQSVLLQAQNEVYILSTMVSFILEYDSKLIE